MKLLTFEEFMKHDSFLRNHGLCSNLSNIYGYRYRKYFEEMCRSMGLCHVYPIGRGSLNKAEADTIIGNRIGKKRDKQYSIQAYNSRLYEGIPLVLRERLYNAFMQYVLER